MCNCYLSPLQFWTHCSPGWKILRLPLIYNITKNLPWPWFLDMYTKVVRDKWYYSWDWLWNSLGDGREGKDGDRWGTDAIRLAWVGHYVRWVITTYGWLLDFSHFFVFCKVKNQTTF
jgi:hypothetical protein